MTTGRINQVAILRQTRLSAKTEVFARRRVSKFTRVVFFRWDAPNLKHKLHCRLADMTAQKQRLISQFDWAIVRPQTSSTFCCSSSDFLETCIPKVEFTCFRDRILRSGLFGASSELKPGRYAAQQKLAFSQVV
jgi:hypothetical protein